MKSIYTVTLLISFIHFFSCSKFIEIDSPANSITGREQFVDSSSATSAVLGIYTNIMSTSYWALFLHGGVTIGAGLSADELVPTLNTESELEIYTNGARSGNTMIDGWWSNAYTIIYQINAVIEGVSSSNGLSSSYKNQLLGEAKFMRALNYFYLANLFGPVPLVTGTDYRINMSLGRTSLDTIHEFIVRDLKESVVLLKENYISAGRVRPNKFAAASLLARELLYLKRWAEAEDAATLVITSNGYSLENDLAKVFSANSPEAIFQMLPSNLGGETADGNLFNPYSSQIVPNYTLSTSLANLFDVNDKRMSGWIGYNDVKVNDITQRYFYPRKYRATAMGGSISKENYMFLRLGEVFLIRAEARANNGFYSGVNSAIDDVNIIRRRAGLVDTTATSQEQALQIVSLERRKELFLELGHRWFDLKRTGLLDAVMIEESKVKGSKWTPTSSLFPIPLLQLQLNPFLKQNEGYN